MILITTKTFIYPNAIVTVEFPDITKEEREKRMKQIREAAADLIKSTLINRKGGDADEADTG